MEENLFSYGTLQHESVQLETFGRTLQGQPDKLIGYERSFVKIEDEAVVATSGMTHHPIISYTGNPEHIIDGVLFTITHAELLHADEYEGDEYKRVLVKLQTGKNAWCYVNTLSTA